MASTNVFMSFYEAPFIKGEVLANIIKDVLTRYNVPVAKMSGFSFENSANMNGLIRACKTG